jgi:DMSO/TMAO reductase YedYZ molybdopterin-dependent catalytic subunit
VTLERSQRSATDAVEGGHDTTGGLKPLAMDENHLIRLSERRRVLPSDELVTPIEETFVVHHYSAPAAIRNGDWVGKLNGHVDRPLTIDFEHLESLPRHHIRAVMECSGNSRRHYAPVTVGTQFRNGTLASIDWSGVSLSTLLDQAEPRPGARNVAVTGADGTGEEHFAKGLPLEKANDPDTILALEMDGAAILHLHGGPVRLVVPGWYGVWSVKWVTHIEVLDHAFDGYWQRERYVYKWPDARPSTPVMTLGVKSLISEPADNAELAAGRHRVAGYAWSDGAPIASVQVRINDGVWRDAEVLPADQRYGWASWELSWDFAPGRYMITSRAVDARGTEQPSVPPWNTFGYANNASQPVLVDVVF